VRLAGAVAAQLPTEALMMRIARLFAAGLALLVIGGLTLAQDKDKKETTLKGTVTCAKCDLKQEKGCKTVIKVKEANKDVIYYFDDKGHKDNHRAICTTPKEGEVTGTVSEKDGKKIVTVSKVKLDTK
jgi:Family of unknown function (DUF6370)